MRAAFLHSSSCSCIWSLLKSWCTSSLLTSTAVTEMTQMINMWTSSPPCFSTGTLTIAHTAHRLQHIHRCIKTVQYAHPSVPACSECCAWECVIVCAEKLNTCVGFTDYIVKKASSLVFKVCVPPTTHTHTSVLFTTASCFIIFNLCSQISLHFHLFPPLLLLCVYISL